MLPQDTTPLAGRIERRCETCGKTFYAEPAKVRRGWARFCSHACRAKSITGQLSPQWRGNRRLTTKGYLRVSLPDGTHDYEHRVVMAQLLGRKLETWEHVHHRNGIRTDNRPENLEIVTPKGHRVLHATETMGARWALKYDACVDCGTTDRRHWARGRCQRCHARYYYHRKRRQVRHG